MEEKVPKEEKLEVKGGAIHPLLTYAYFVFLLAVILGLIFDLFIQVNLGWGIIHSGIGVLSIIAGSLLVYWSQYSSSLLSKYGDEKEVTTQFFKNGPYRFLRNPSYLGVFILSLGLALVLKSFFSVIFSILSYLVVRIVFVKREEKILSQKYGQVYKEYKDENTDIL